MGLTRTENKPKYIGSVLKDSKVMSKVKSSCNYISKSTLMKNVNREDFRTVEIRLKGGAICFHSMFRNSKCYFIEDDSKIYIFR